MINAYRFTNCIILQRPITNNKRYKNKLLEPVEERYACQLQRYILKTIIVKRMTHNKLKLTQIFVINNKFQKITDLNTNDIFAFKV